MPDGSQKKISELPVAPAAHPTDLLETSQADGTGYVSRSITLAQVAAGVVAPPPAWTDITGKPATFPPTLPIPESGVTNLVSDLAGKAPVSHSHTAGDLPPYPTSLPPSGTAGGALTGTYPNPTLVGGPLSNYLTTANAATTYAPVVHTHTASQITDFSEATDDRVAALLVAGTNVTLNYNDPANTLTINSTASGGGAGTVTSVSVVSANGLAGTVATPTATPAITLSTTVTGLLKGNGTAISAATAGTDYVTPGAIPLTTGAVGYGAAGVLTGVAANLAFDATNKRLGINNASPGAAVDVVAQANTAAITMSGYSLTGSNATGCFGITATLNTTGQPDIFAINVTDTSNAGGNAFVIRGGPSGTASLIRTTMSGDTRVAGWCQARLNDALVTNGADYFAYYLGNGSGGNIGLFAGLSNPTFSTFGRYGSIYLNGASPGVPWYNSNSTTGWTMLAPITAVGTTAPTAPVDGQLWYYSDASNGGGALYIRYNDGNTTQWVPASPAATPGSLLQTVFTETGAVATTTTLIPFDDTIPQIGEGFELMTCTITPKSATSRLLIQITAHLSSSATNATPIGALFQDSTANALAASFSFIPAAATYVGMTFSHVMTSGTTSATTFRFRAGSAAAGTLTFNGSGGGRIFGGVMASSIVIQEVA